MQHNDLLRIGGDPAHRIGNGLGRIGGSGKYFQDLQRGILKPNAVSEGTAAINGDSERDARSCGPLRGRGFWQSNSHSLGIVILSEARLWNLLTCSMARSRRIPRCLCYHAAERRSQETCVLSRRRLTPPRRAVPSEPWRMPALGFCTFGGDARNLLLLVFRATATLQRSLFPHASRSGWHVGRDEALEIAIICDHSLFPINSPSMESR